MKVFSTSLQSLPSSSCQEWKKSKQFSKAFCQYNFGAKNQTLSFNFFIETCLYYYDGNKFSPQYNRLFWFNKEFFILFIYVGKKVKKKQRNEEEEVYIYKKFYNKY